MSSVTQIQTPDGSDGLVEQRGDVLLLVAVRGTENHHAVLMGGIHTQRELAVSPQH